MATATRTRGTSKTREDLIKEIMDARNPDVLAGLDEQFAESKKLVMTPGDRAALRSSVANLDINAPLTPEEYAMMGQALEQWGDDAPSANKLPDVAVKLHDFDEDTFAPTGVQPVADTNKDYNQLYAHYLKCQSLVTIMAFEEGWKNFKEMVLYAYVKMKIRESKEYTGDNRDKLSNLAIRLRTAEDFVRFIETSMAEATAVQKPVLKQ